MVGWVDIPGRLWAIGRKIEDLLALQQSTTQALKILEVKIRAIEDRVTHLEASHGQVITEAKAASAAAATVVAGGIFSETVTRLTRIEMRLEALPPPDTARSLSPPDQSA